MNNLYIKFSFLVLILFSLTGPLVAQTTSETLTNPKCPSCKDGRIDVEWTFSHPRVTDLRVRLYDSSGRLVHTENYAPYNFTKLAVGTYTISYEYKSGNWRDYTTKDVSLSSAAVTGPFEQRTSQNSVDKKIYNIKGDFTMIGNTNLTLENYSENGNNSGNMVYVDVDSDPSTLNSSSATLAFSTENEAKPQCSNVIYAGLYWTGRSSTTRNSFTISEMGTVLQVVDEDFTVENDDDLPSSDFSMSVSHGNYYYSYPDWDHCVVYNFESSDGTDIRFLFFDNNKVLYRIGSGDYTKVTGNVNTVSGIMTASFAPITIYSETGGITLTVDELKRGSATNQYSSYYEGNSEASGNVSGIVTVETGMLTKTYNKREIFIKHAGESTYQKITARADDIHYPTNTHSAIFAAYAEVTDYVQKNGIGEYFVADMALREGDDDGGTGYSGGWGLVVVYENSKMNWRDVTLFDGYAYVKKEGNGVTSYDLPISGFNAVQSGDVNIKLGLMASEGDVDIPGDFIKIQNAAQNNWISLSHEDNATNNFFNSSISTGDDTRNPNLKNNTGVDISMFDVPNTGNSNIENGQTSTKFRYGTSQDTYAIFALAMAVDAYVPEAVATNIITNIEGFTGDIVDGTPVSPGGTISYRMDIRNRGTEAITDAQLVLPVPYTTTCTSWNVDVGSVDYDHAVGATGSIVWNIGTLPVPDEGPDQILGTLTYTLKVTEDCSILGNVHCSPSVAVGGGGGSTGTGATSHESITGFSIITGYELEGECAGEPITTPVNIVIDTEDFVLKNCKPTEIETEQEYFYCNLGSSAVIGIGDVNDYFPPGCRFYNSNPNDEDTIEDIIEYTDGFPASIGTETYYAVPPGYTSCFYKFKITVKNITSEPKVTNVRCCEGDTDVVLQVNPSVDGYELFYFTDETGGISHSTLDPSTDVPTTTTYWVSEGESASCLSPNRVPLEVTVNPLPTVPIGTASRSFCGSATIADLVASSGSDVVDWYSVSIGGAVLNSTDALSSGTYYAEARNETTDCVSSSRLPVSVSVNPSVSVDAGSNKRICQGDPVVLSPTVSPASGTFSYEWRIQGETDILASTKDYTFDAVGDPNLNSTVKYEVTAMDDLTGCSSTDVVSVTTLSSPSTTTVTSLNPSCPNLDSGSITFSFPDHPNRTNIQFSVNDSSGSYENSADNAGSYTFSGLVSGDYNLWVRWGNKDCPLDLGVLTLVLDNIPDVSFTYAQSVYCTNDENPTPNITTSGGSFTSTTGISIDSTTGVIDLSASIGGAYVVTYTIEGDCGGSSSQEVTINTSPKPIGIFFD